MLIKILFVIAFILVTANVVYGMWLFREEAGWRDILEDSVHQQSIEMDRALAEMREAKAGFDAAAGGFREMRGEVADIRDTLHRVLDDQEDAQEAHEKTQMQFSEGYQNLMNYSPSTAKESK